MLGSVFVRGHILLNVAGKTLEFLNRKISVYGTSGLPWAPLNPDKHYGIVGDVRLTVLSEPPEAIETKALLLRETSNYSEQLGLKYLLSKENRVRLEYAIDRAGFFPTEYVRKYPRIPSAKIIALFPMNVVAQPVFDGVPGEPFIASVGNLSPNGMLITTENSKANRIGLGTKIRLAIDPRGTFPAQIYMSGQVCRALDEKDEKSGNTIRHLGIKFTAIDEINQAAFSQLLREILKEITRKQLATRS